MLSQYSLVSPRLLDSPQLDAELQAIEAVYPFYRSCPELERTRHKELLLERTARPDPAPIRDRALFSAERWTNSPLLQPRR
jgi:hypothetical protein